MYTAYSRYKIYEKDNVPFSPAQYSKFKYGDYQIAAEFGQQLFDGFIRKHGQKVLDHPAIVLLPSPYHHIPTASYFLAEHFEQHLNFFLAQNGRPAVTRSKIHRNKTYSEDYGALTREERINLIKNQ